MTVENIQLTYGVQYADNACAGRSRSLKLLEFMAGRRMRAEIVTFCRPSVITGSAIDSRLAA